jgi:hypothetical protein
MPTIYEAIEALKAAAEDFGPDQQISDIWIDEDGEIIIDID